ncbi:MAG: 16S rRNA (guanine(966)-N(2))-methyltransferase RsmD [Firmicutes bacterium]|nr:16S rRNA (guanine(966)-N(2))-methyltransferase RsmD [Bacillota bacterium]
MRIITGLARGRKLKEPKGQAIRPTADMVKEAIFNIVQFDVAGRRVLDLCAGTGQLGIEALSRGAASCAFVDESREAYALIKENLRLSGLAGGDVIQAEALGYLGRCEALGFPGREERFDLIFLDPPYGTELLEKALLRIFQFDILADGGIIICESGREERLPDAKAPYVRKRDYGYGKTKLTVYTREGASADDHSDLPRQF